MERPDVSKLSKKVQDYIRSLEHKIEVQREAIEVLDKRNPETDVYVELGNRQKVYFPEEKGVYFGKSGAEALFVAYYKDKILKIMLLNGRLSVRPCGGCNSVDLVREKI